MHYFRICIIISIALICFSAAFPESRITLYPGAAFFADGTGYKIGLGYRTSLNFMPGVFTGIDASYIDAIYSVSNFTHRNIKSTLDAGYSFTLMNGLTLSPFLKAGVSYASIANSYSNVSLFGFAGGPAAGLDYALTSNVSIGIEAEYLFTLNSFFSSVSLNSVLAVSYVFSAPAESRETNDASSTATLENSLKETIKEDNIQATVEEENSNEIKLSISDVLFDLDSDKVSRSYESVIQSIVLMAEKYPYLSVEIEGFTDDKGDENYNIKLSTSRAKNVAAIFIANGMARNRISFKGRGKEDPIVPNTSDENRQKNRRVEIRFTENQR
jgi:outer membrane protein OmpA-like peptidoglycan-associated protein